jgi:hypothetical protein
MGDNKLDLRGRERPDSYMGERQKQLLKLLRGSKPSLRWTSFSRPGDYPQCRATASRNSRGGRVGGRWRDTSVWRRPAQRLYVGTERGKEMAPRPYSWLAQLVVASVRRGEGIDMGTRMTETGANVAQQIRSQYRGLNCTARVSVAPSLQGSTTDSFIRPTTRAR